MISLYIITPVRNASNELREYVDNIIDVLLPSYYIHYPPYDTKQDDGTGGYEICRTNKRAIEDADIVLLFWDGVSQGCLFDAGIAFALDKLVVVLMTPELVVGGKSFQNMFAYWEMAGTSRPDFYKVTELLNFLDTSIEGGIKVLTI